MERHKSDSIPKHIRFERLHSAYSGRIYNLVMKISHGDSYLAEEITQTVFLRLWEKFDLIDENQNPKSYLFQIARNTLLNHLKHDTIEYIYLNYMKDVPTEDYYTQNSVDSQFLNQYMMQLVEELPFMRRKVFTMSRLQYLSNKQISDELGISVSTVETHLTLALKFMREELKKRYGIICMLTTIISSCLTII